MMDSVNEDDQGCREDYTEQKEKSEYSRTPAVPEGAGPDEKELKAIWKSLNICTAVMGVCTPRHWSAMVVFLSERKFSKQNRCRRSRSATA